MRLAGVALGVLVLLVRPDVSGAYIAIPYVERIEYAVRLLVPAALILGILNAVLLRVYFSTAEGFGYQRHIVVLVACYFLAVLAMGGVQASSETIHYEAGVVLLSVMLPVQYYLCAKHLRRTRRILQAAFLYVPSFMLVDYLVMYRLGASFRGLGLGGP